MEIRIAFRGMDHSDAMEAYAREALSKLDKFLQKEQDPIFIDLVLEAARQHHHHKVELRINSKHYHFIIAHESAEMYPLIDHVVKIAIDEIEKKDKALDQRNHPDLSFKKFEE